MTGDDYMTITTRVFLRLWYGGLKGIVWNTLINRPTKPDAKNVMDIMRGSNLVKAALHNY